MEDALQLMKFALQYGWLDFYRTASIVISVVVVLNCTNHLRRKPKLPETKASVIAPVTPKQPEAKQPPVAQAALISSSCSTGSLDRQEKPKPPKKKEEVAKAKPPAKVTKKPEEKKNVAKENKKIEKKEEEVVNETGQPTKEEKDEPHENTVRIEMSDDDHTKTKTFDFSAIDVGNNEGGVDDIDVKAAENKNLSPGLSAYMVDENVAKLQKKPSKIRVPTESPEKTEDRANKTVRKEKKATKHVSEGGGITNKKKKDGTQESVECL